MDQQTIDKKRKLLTKQYNDVSDLLEALEKKIIILYAKKRKAEVNITRGHDNYDNFISSLISNVDRNPKFPLYEHLLEFDARQYNIVEEIINTTDEIEKINDEIQNLFKTLKHLNDELIKY